MGRLLKLARAAPEGPRPPRSRAGRPGRAALLAGAIVAAGCAGPPSTAIGGDRAEPRLLRGDFRRELVLTGELRAVRSIEVKAPQTSLFQMRIQFMAEEGAAVRRGDRLLDFDNSGLAEQVDELESNILDAETQIVTKDSELESKLKDLEIELAEKEFAHERARLLAAVDPEVLSRKEHGERLLARETAERELQQVHDEVALTRQRGEAELDVLRISRDKLRKDLLVARSGLELLSIRAPAAGLVIYGQRPDTTLRYQEGDSCWPGQVVLSLPDLSEMETVFAVSEVDAPLLAPGLEVAIRLDSFPGRELAGEIVQVPSMAVKLGEASKVSVFKVVARLAETWQGEMKPGMSVQGRVVVDERSNVPLAARGMVRFDGARYLLRRPAADGSEQWDPIDPVARNERFYVLSEEDFIRLGGEPAPTAAVAGGGDAS